MTKYSFENFYINRNNKQAFLAAQLVAEHLGETENPLYIYGGSQMGKTHILHAIEQHVRTHNPDLNILLTTSEEFVNSILEAVRTGRSEGITEFREKHRNVDLLLVDDIQFLTNKIICTTEFIHTFNSIYEAGGQIVITGNMSPQELRKEGLSELLVSRLGWGRIVEIPQDMQYLDE